MLKMIDKKYLLAVGLILGLFLTGVLAISWSNWSYRNQNNTDTMIAVSQFVNDVIASPEITTEVSAMTQRVNLERKIVAFGSEREKVAIKQAVESVGGSLVSDGTSNIVVLIPKSEEINVETELEKLNVVVDIEVDYPVKIAGDNVGWGIQKIDVPPVWPITQASGIKVAVIDTGVDYNHPDLRERYLGGYDFVNSDPDPMDDHGHGTHVAGIIASSENGSGIKGAAPQAVIYALKVLDSDGAGYISDIVSAIDWAMAQGVQVVNMSLGTTYDSSVLRSKVAEAQSRGVFLVAAAGNTYGGPLMYPAAYDAVIAVSATDESDRFASFSSLGAEVSAPGVNITSTTPNGSYSTWSGTSMASPHVAGSIALMMANGQLNIRDRLQKTAVDLGAAGKDVYFGYGRINAKPAVLGDDVLAPVVSFVSPKNGSEVSGVVNVKLDIQDEGEIVRSGMSVNGIDVVSWTDQIYQYDLDTTTWINQTITLVATAEDDSGNIGASQLSLKVLSENSITNPSPTSAPSVTVSPTPISQSSGNSINVRQDLNSPAIEVRQDTNRAPQELPPVSNWNNRQNQFEIESLVNEIIQNSEESVSPGKSGQAPGQSNSAADNMGRRPQVRGVATNLFDMIRSWFVWW
jgi:hypothetical protein